MGEPSKRLVFVSEYLGGLSGMSKAGLEIFGALASTTNRLTVISSHRPIHQGGRGKGVECIVAPKRMSFSRRIKIGTIRETASWAKWSVLGLINNWRLRRLVPDILFVNSLGNHEYISQLPIPRPDSCVLIVHDSPARFLGQHYPARGLDWALSVLNCYSHLVFVSSRCREEWGRHHILRNKETFYVPNCCNEDDVSRLLARNKQDVRRALGLDPDRFVAVCVASLQHLKGQDILVKNLDKLLLVVPKLKLLMIGPRHGDPSYRETLEKEIRQGGYADYVHFTGPMANATEYIYAADTLVQPSRVEAMPLTILEAMALRTAVIATPVGGIPELIKHKDSGWLFSHQTPNQLLEGFHVIASDVNQREMFVRNASTRYWSEFSRSLLAQRYNRVVERIGASIRTGGCTSSAFERELAHSKNTDG